MEQVTSVSSSDREKHDELCKSLKPGDTVFVLGEVPDLKWLGLSVGDSLTVESSYTKFRDRLVLKTTGGKRVVMHISDVKRFDIRNVLLPEDLAAIKLRKKIEESLKPLDPPPPF